MPANPQE
jgi:hypothetical protein